MLSEADCRSEEKIDSTECGIGALGKIIYYHYDNEMVNQEIVRRFLELLPLRGEPEEAQNVHKLFITNVLNKTPQLMGENNSNAEIVKTTVLRMKEYSSEHEDLELIDDFTKPLIEQAISLF